MHSPTAAPPSGARAGTWEPGAASGRFLWLLAGDLSCCHGPGESLPGTAGTGTSLLRPELGTAPGQGLGPHQLGAKGEEAVSWARVILGLQHPAESTRLEFKVKLHSGFLALHNALFLFPPKTPILPWGDKHKPSSLIAPPQSQGSHGRGSTLKLAGFL